MFSRSLLQSQSLIHNVTLQKCKLCTLQVLKFKYVNSAAALSMPSSTERFISNVPTIEKYKIFILKNLEMLLHCLNFEMNIQHESTNWPLCTKMKQKKL